MAKCTYCKQAVTLKKARKESAESPVTLIREVKGLIKKEIMYSCPRCDSVLGFGSFIGGLATGRP
jgi:hypothetical protein